MSPTVLALLQRIDRECRSAYGSRVCPVTGAFYPRDYLRAAEQVWRNPWCLPMYSA